VLKCLSRQKNDTLIFVVLSTLCIIVPFDLSQLAFACLGAVFYYLVTVALKWNVKPKPTKKLVCNDQAKIESKCPPWRETARSATTRKPAREASPSNMKPVMPVLAPKFQGVGLEAEIHELLQDIMPSKDSERAVDRMAEAVRCLLASTLPGVEVTGFANSDPSRGRANGVAVPDIDIVVNISPDTSVAMKGKMPSDPRLHQKAILRVCADKLVSAGGFKFRRSAFKGSEPKVTLLAPSQLGIFAEAMPVDVSVNAVTPLHCAALLTECASIEPQSKELIVLVRRWAKDRGICHAPKGHLPPHVWNLLAIYFLQVTSLLPAVEELELSAKLLPGGAAKSKTWARADGGLKASTAQLFQSFMDFYSKDFDWTKECVCVRLGERGQIPLKLPIHIMTENGNSKAEAGPSIEDPFNHGNNLGSCMNVWSFGRMKEELQRGAELLEASASLSTFLQPWVPPEAMKENL